MKKLFFIVSIIMIIMTNAAQAIKVEPNDDYTPSEVQEVQKQFNNAQFLIVLDAENSRFVDEYLFIIDHSWYEISEDSFYAFCENYVICKQAIDEYNAGNKDVDFDCVFDY